MGYCVDIGLNDVVIRKANEMAALKAVNELFAPKKMSGGGGRIFINGQEIRQYSWVNAPAEPFKDLIDALAEWRYQAERNETGDIVVECFTGQKLGDDTVLWTALAPFVDPAGEIYCSGEDGAQWKWTFRNGQFTELLGQVVYEDEKPPAKDPKKPRKKASRPPVGLDRPRRIAP